MPLFQVNAQPDSSSRPFTGSSLDETAGKALFERRWVTPPASTAASDGLGPYYNAVSCDTCHPKGRQGETFRNISGIPDALVLHFLTPGARNHFGYQWQPYAVRGLVPESVSIAVTYESHRLRYEDGEEVVLSRPGFSVSGEAANILSPDTVLSARLAPDLHGVHLLADISQESSSQESSSQEGSSQEGRWLGHLGWQGTQKSLREQIALALSRDLGLGNPLFPSAAGDCSQVQNECLSLSQTTLSGDSPETGEEVLRLLEEYLRGLPVPETPLVTEDESGRQIFSQLACDSCHEPVTGDQFVYSDLVLHDMGAALADRTITGEPVPTRWRTAPLWSLAERLGYGGTAFLHDGRAATLEEAILWHGGEAEQARTGFMALDRQQRIALLTWLSYL